MGLILPAYRRLVRLYPASYRHRYGQRMVDTLEDMLQAAPSATGRTTIGLRLLAETPLSIGRQHLSMIGATMSHDMPEYIKRNAVLSSILLVPFFVLIALTIIAHPYLGGAPLQAKVIYFLVVILPLLALVLSVATLASWVEQQAASGRRVLASLFDLRRNWPLIGTACLALMIPLFLYGHDSVECITGNPIREVRNLHATLQCIRER
jgi:lysylphosphatidylglycerol synthetase-like protein (DUF2156 family)